MLLLDIPTIQPPAPGVPCAWLVVAPNPAENKPFLDEGEAIAYAHWRNGWVYPLVRPDIPPPPKKR